MRHGPHETKRAAFRLVLASTFLMGLLLLFYVPSHRISGSLALGVMTVLILKHVGLLLILGSPLAGVMRVASSGAKRFLRQHICRVG